MINHFAPMHLLSLYAPIVTHQADPGATFRISAAHEAHRVARAQRLSETKRIRFIEPQQAQPLAVDVPYNLGFNTTSQVSVYFHHSLKRCLDNCHLWSDRENRRDKLHASLLHSRVHEALLVMYTLPIDAS